MAFRKKFRVSIPMVLVFLLLASVLAFTLREGFTESVDPAKPAKKATATPVPASPATAAASPVAAHM